MRYSVYALFVLILFTGCSKQDASLEAIKNQSVVVSSDALQPLKYHSISFKTDYSPTGSQPFSFTKELYTDTRVKRVQMRSRAFINHPSVDTHNYYYDFDYRFTYSTNKAIITRSYKFSGDPARTNIGPESFECLFNANGYCTSIKKITTSNNPNDALRMQLFYSGKKLTRLFVGFSQEEPGSGTYGDFAVQTDASGNVLSIKSTDQGSNPFARNPNVYYTYNYSKTGNYCYMPTQYVFSQWFSLLESMQWVPMQVNERKTVRLVINYKDFSAGEENPKDAVISQGQNYFSHKYDANGNLISYTYGDGVAQRITWK